MTPVFDNKINVISNISVKLKKKEQSHFNVLTDRNRLGQ